jgi:hypothetical protein
MLTKKKLMNYTNMELKNITEETLPLNKLTHLRLQIEDTETLRQLVSLMDDRRKIISASMQDWEKSLDAYDFNERKISAVKTNIELAKVHTAIIRKENYIAEHKKLLVKTLVEMQEKWSETFDKLSKIANTNDAAKELLDKFDMATFDANWEIAIDFYFRAKNIIEPPKEQPKKLAKV